MFTNYPHVYEAEIVETMAPDSSDRLRKNVVRYTCRVRLRNNGEVMIKNVVEATMFGGVADYFQRRARASKDSGDEFRTGLTDDKSRARIGDRALVIFLGGHVEQPVIIGWLQHPNQAEEFADPDMLDPQAVFQYLGLRIKMLPDGGLQIIHQGAPKISPIPATNTTDPANPQASPMTAAMAPAADTELTVIELLKSGIYRVRDADGQMIELDRANKKITLSNQAMTSDQDPTSAPDPSDSESMTFDSFDKSIVLKSREKMSINTDGDRTDQTKGDQKETIGGAWTVEATGDVSLKGSGGAAAKLSGGQVAFGGPAGELLDTVSKGLADASKTATQASIIIVPTIFGPSGPPTNAPAFVQLAAHLLALQAIIELIKAKL